MVSKGILAAIVIVAILIIGGGIYTMQNPSEQITESITTVTRTYTATVTENPKVPSKSGAYELVGTSRAIRLSDPTQLEKIGVDVGIGPEDVSVDAQGRIYGGMVDGKIIRFQSDGSSPEVLADTKGRPLGLHFDADGNLIIADAIVGLLSMAPDGTLTVLSTEADGLPFKFTDDVDIADDGLIYFSDASFKYTITNLTAAAMDQPAGRLMVYDPETKMTTVLLEDLYFANGVAVSPDQSFVVVAESMMLRAQRYWLTGPRKGESEIFIDKLIDVPDGISSNGRDGFWMALYSHHSGCWLGLDMEGNVIHYVQLPFSDPMPLPGSYAPITSVQEHDGVLYLGSTEANSLARVPIPPDDLRQ